MASASVTLTREAQRRPLVLVLVLLALVSLGFVLFPKLDLAFSGLFYESATGFFQRHAEAVETVRSAGRIATWVFVIAVASLLPIKVLFPRSRLLMAPRKILFVLIAFALGPGLIVNLILKDFWGRARPREILEFGGEATFSPAWWISSECHLNCSFVSGEAASAFCLVALAFVVSEKWRSVTAIATIAFAAAVSFARIAAGAHFLSDVLIAWLVVLLVLIALQRIILKGLPPAFDDRAEAGARRVGERLRRLFAPRDGSSGSKRIP